MNIGRDAIYNCLWGRSKTSAGYKWKYADEMDADGKSLVQDEPKAIDTKLIRCNHQFKSGARKGEICNSAIRDDNEKCSRHRKK